ncbi:MAG: YcgL domain-containing protein [Dyella sp.]
MHCYVYASQRKPDTYLWMSQRDMFDALPESLLLLLGELSFVLEVELSGQRKLPQENIDQVLENLSQQGWHLQLPPTETLAVANHPGYRTTPQTSSDEDLR